MIPIETVPIVVFRLVNAEQLHHLMLVDEQNIGCFHQFGRQRRGERRIVEQHFHARFMAHARGGRHRFDRAFQAQAKYGRPCQRIAHGFHIIHGDLRVRSRRVHDGVFAGCVHGNHGCAGWSEHAANMRGVHARLAQSAKQEVGVGIGADRAEHLHGCADARCGGRLVAGFSARQQLQRTAGDGLPRPWQTLCGDGVVRVHRADYGHCAVDAVQCGENFSRAHLYLPYIKRRFMKMEICEIVLFSNRNYRKSPFLLY